MIAGNLATNAGGIKFIRHNSLHANTIGLKAVLADGTILDNMTNLRKDNTGYDLKHLFIGSEGTLGIITECSLLCPPLPQNRNVAMVSCNSFESVLEILKATKAELGDCLQAIECMDRKSMEIVLSQMPTAQYPFSKMYPFYVLIETGSLSKSPEVDTTEAEPVSQKGGDEDMDKVFRVFEKASSHIIVSKLISS
jgi:FAD/FMN-containing dehydrogenase